MEHRWSACHDPSKDYDVSTVLKDSAGLEGKGSNRRDRRGEGGGQTDHTRALSGPEPVSTSGLQAEAARHGRADPLEHSEGHASPQEPMSGTHPAFVRKQRRAEGNPASWWQGTEQTAKQSPCLPHLMVHSTGGTLLPHSQQPPRAFWGSESGHMCLGWGRIVTANPKDGTISQPSLFPLHIVSGQ